MGWFPALYGTLTRFLLFEDFSKIFRLRADGQLFISKGGAGRKNGPQPHDKPVNGVFYFNFSKARGNDPNFYTL